MKTAEQLFTCPLCHRENFTKRGLQSHRCKAKPGRAGLNGLEYAAAIVVGKSPRKPCP
jgi:hypothetical protein